MANIERNLNFEGVGDLQRVRGFYAAQGITFSENAVGLVDSDAGGSGNFGGEASANTVIAYAEGNSITMNLNFPDEIASGEVSFFYTSPRQTHQVRILDAAGNVLKTETLARTPAFGAPDPRGEFSPLIQRKITFTGNAKSIQFGRSKYELGLDNIQFNLLTASPVNNRPTDIGLSNNRIAENSANGTVISSLTTTDPDAGDTHAYALLDNAGGRFALTNNQLTVANGSLLDFEATPNYTIRVRTTDSAGNTFEETFTINLIDVNETSPIVNNAPTDIALSAAVVAENSPANTVIGVLSASDRDPGDTQTFTLLDNAGGRFALTNNQLTVANGALLDFETNPNHTIRVRTTDSASNSFDKAFTITVNNITESPTDIALSAAIVPENSLAGTVIGILSATTPDVGASQTFTLLDNAGGRFSIAGNQLIANNQALLDFETNQNHTVTVRATTAGGKIFDKAFTITVNNVNEAPTDIALSATVVAENSALGTVVGDLSATDPDVGDAQTLTLLDDAGGRFTLTDNQLSVANGELLDFEANQNHTVTVRATDAEGLNFDKTFTINVTDIEEIVNQPPVAEDDTVTGTTTDLVGTAGDDSITYVLSGPTTFQVADLLANDSDPDNDAINIIAVNDVANGNGTVAFNGNITFTPTFLNSSSQGSFQYTLSDSNGNTDTASVTANVPGIQRIDASTGNDTLFLTSPSVQVNLGNAADQTATIDMQIDSDGFVVTGFENVVGTQTLDLIFGDDNTNYISGLDGDDYLSDANYSPSSAAFNGNDTIDGGNGNDDIQGGSGNDLLDGGAGNDFLVAAGSNGNNTLVGGDGNDSIQANSNGNDFLDGGIGDDDLFVSFEGNDTLYGGDGNDLLDGDDGNDLLDGGAGNDSLVSSGSDEGDVSNNTLSGGEGNDTLVSLNAGDEDRDSLSGGAGNDYLSATDGNDTLDGGVGDDTLTGNRGNDILNGGAGNDTLDGSVGDNTLTGGDGNDFLYCSIENGNNTLTGGNGADSFFFFINSPPEGGDLIVDFVSGTDKINVSASGFVLTGVAGDPVPFEAFTTLPIGSGSRFLFNETTRQLFFDGIGNNVTGPDNLLATFESGTVVGSDLLFSQ